MARNLIAKNQISIAQTNQKIHGSAQTTTMAETPKEENPHWVKSLETKGKRGNQWERLIKKIRELSRRRRTTKYNYIVDSSTDDEEDPRESKMDVEDETIAASS